jgi:hypothetical protein
MKNRAIPAISLKYVMAEILISIPQNYGSPAVPLIPDLVQDRQMRRKHTTCIAFLCSLATLGEARRGYKKIKH